MKNYGFIKDERIESDYVFGGRNLPDEILTDGDWTDFLPTKELQAPYGFETYACVTFVILTCVEAILKRRYGVERNYSDRFLAIVSGTKSPGNSPRTVCDFLRKIGVVPQELWPYDNSVNTWAKWSEPVPPKLYELAREFNNELDFRYELVPSNHETITQALKRSPLLISFSAWYQKNGKYYRPQGMSDNHATTMFNEKPSEFRRVFDSYDQPHIKDLEWEDIPQFVMKFWVKKRTEVVQQIGIIQRILILLKSLIGLVEKEGASTPTIAPITPVIAPQPQPEPLLITWARAIETYEGANKSWNNPGAIRSKEGPFLKFKTYQEGWDYLLDYLTRAATGKHNAYKPEYSLLKFFEIYSPWNDNNNPQKYAEFVAKRLNAPITEQIKNLV